MNTICRLLCALSVVGAFISSPVFGANFTTTTVQAGGDALGFNNTIWQGTAPVAGNTYEALPGSRVRSPDGAGSATFNGDRLTLDGNGTITAASVAELRFKAAANGVVNIPDLHVNGGLLNNGNASVFTLQGKLTVDAPSIIDNGSTVGSAIDQTRGIIVAAQLLGGGSLTIQTGGTNQPVNLTGTSNLFTGNWIVTGGYLKGTGNGSLGTGNITIGGANPTRFEVMYDLATGGRLILTNNAVMLLHQNIVVGSLIINGSNFVTGAYSYAQLASTYPNSFPAGGSGSITVGVISPPPTPAGVTAAGVDGQVVLTWFASASATGYNVKKSTTPGGPYTTIFPVATTNYTDTAVVNASDYYYVVSATNSAGESANSVEVAAHPNPIVTGVTAVGGTNQVVLSWAPLSGATSYSVLRAISANGPFVAVASGLTTTDYTDTTVQNGTTYYYRISGALTGAGASGQSATVPSVTAPGAPIVTAKLFASTVQTLAWTTPDGTVSRFNVERSTDGANFIPVGSVLGTQRAFTNSGLALNTTYFYRLQATNSGGYSSYSTVVSNTTPTIGYNINFSLGGTTPVPPGYSQDIGDLFGDRTNGLFYGWTNSAGTNITVDARYRANVNSPDLRYDTLVHIQKSAGGAVWEIEIPNGFYRVHVVGGDPTAVDSTFQYNIEGVITPAYTPTTGNWWADFTTNTAVFDGRLTISAGPQSANGKINFVDIYPDIPVPPAFAVQPQSLATEEWRVVSLSPVVTGSAALVYQWYKDGLLLENATNSALVFNRVRQTNAGDYYLVVTNFGGSITSAVATVTVTPDTTAPIVLSVGSLDGRTIGVRFNEDVDTNSQATTESLYYLVNGGSVNATASLRPDSRTVLLTLDAPITGDFTVEVSNVPDYAGNTVSDQTVTGTVRGFTGQDVGGPARPGSSFTSDGDTIEVVGGGADIWSTSDQGYFVTKTITGDFDLRMRVNSLAGANAVTKAALVARETTNADSRAIHVSVNPPPPGRDQVEMGYRDVVAGATAVVGIQSTGAGIPNAYLRLTRLGNTFTGFRSSNAVDWIQVGQTNATFPADMAVGFAITAHDNNLLATGLVSGVTIVQSFPDLSVSANGVPEPVAVGGNITYTISLANAGAGAAPGTVLRDVLPNGVTYVSSTSSQGACTVNAGTVTCNLGTLATGGAATVTIVVTATNAGLITNLVSAVSSVIDPNGANDAATVVSTVSSGPAQERIVNFGFNGGSFGGSIQTQPGVTYRLEYKDDLTAATWSLLTTITGDGTVKPFGDSNPNAPMRFYRITVQ